VSSEIIDSAVSDALWLLCQVWFMSSACLTCGITYYCPNGVLYSLYFCQKICNFSPWNKWIHGCPFYWFEGPSRHRRQARKLISDPSPTTKRGLLSFNRTQSRFVLGLLSGHNTHFHLMGLTNNPSCRGVVQRKKPQSTFCVSVMLWLHSDMHSGFLLLGLGGC